MVTRDPLDANREDAPREAARLLTRTHRHDEEASILFLLQDGWIDREIGAMGRGRTQKERGEGPGSSDSVVPQEAAPANSDPGRPENPSERGTP